MFCKNCGTQIADNQAFCPVCGTAQDQAQQTPPVYQQPQQQQQGYYQSAPNQQIPNQPPVYQPAPASDKSKVAAGLLAIFLGSLGIHKFYMGYSKSGLIMLLVTLIGGAITLGVAAGVMGIIAFIEGIMYLTKSDADFYNTYVANQKEWF